MRLVRREVRTIVGYVGGVAWVRSLIRMLQGRDRYVNKGLSALYSWEKKRRKRF